jgi:hypothetical protein
MWRSTARQPGTVLEPTTTLAGLSQADRYLPGAAATDSQQPSRLRPRQAPTQFSGRSPSLLRTPKLGQPTGPTRLQSFRSPGVHFQPATSVMIE